MQNTLVSLLIQNYLWTHHITYISTKISKSLIILAILRHFVPSSTLLNIYRSLVQPYLSYGIAVWGQAHACSQKFGENFDSSKTFPWIDSVSNPLGSTLYLCSNCLMFFLSIFFILKQFALLCTMYQIM